MKHVRIRCRATVAVAAAAVLTTSGLAGVATGPAIAGSAELSDATLRVGANFASVAMFDPVEEAGIPISTEWMSLIYGRLLRPLPEREVAPGLVTEWATPDDQTIELTLRDGVEFTDGTPFNGDAVKFSWERCRDEATFKIEVFDALERVDVVDDTHVTVVLNKPVAGAWLDFLLLGNVYCMSVVSPGAVESVGEGFRDAPVGAGPYMLESYEEDQKVVLVRNPDFYDPEQQPYARIEFTHVALGPSTVTALAADQVDIARLSIADAPAVEAAGLSLLTEPGDVLSHLYLCTTDGAFSDPEARRAVRRAIDAEELIKVVTQGRGLPAWQLMPEGSSTFSDVGLADNQFDLDAAKELAASSGLEGQTVDLMYYAISPEQAAIGEVVKAQLERIGVTVNLIPSQNIYADRSAQKPDISMWGSFPAVMTSVLQVGQVANPCENNSPEIDSALADLWRSDDAAAGAAADALQTAINEQNPIITYGRTVYAAAYNDSVGGTIFQPWIHALGQIDYTMLRPND